MNLATGLTMMFSVLMPARIWYAPNAPLNVTPDADVRLVLTDFAGKQLDPKGSAEVTGGKAVDLRSIFPILGTSGTYVLFAVPKDKAFPEFVGTPVVIQVRGDRKGQIEGPVVVRMEPLRYLTMTTDQGDMTWAFWYDVAPNTTLAILGLAEQGYYDGLTFHRILPDFVLQGGDPRGDGQGGPGFNIDEEFSERKHVEGVLSMARNSDEREGRGQRPGPEAANSGGSQFFIVLSTKPHLDTLYTAFGQVVEGMDTVKAIAKTPLADPQMGRPVTPPVIKKAEVKAVTPQRNPYAGILGMKK